MSSHARRVRELAGAADRRRATALARKDRGAIDDATAREALDRFNALLISGRIKRTEMSGVVQAAEAIAQVHRSDFSRAVALRLRGLEQHLRGRSRRGLADLERSAARFDRAGASLDAGDVYRSMIDVAMFAGDTGRAQTAAGLAARRYATRTAGPRRRGALAMNRGNLDHRLDRLQSALERYSEARRHYVRHGNPVLVAHADYNKANVLCSLDRTREARGLYERAREAYVAAKSPPAIQADYAIAGVDLLEGRLEPCIVRLEDVERRHRCAGDPAGVAHARLERGEALLRLNRAREAEQAAEAALAWFKPHGYDIESTACCGVLAAAYLQQGRASRAATLFARAAAAERDRGNPVAASLHDVGVAQARSHKQPEEAWTVASSAARTFARRGLRSRQARALTVAAQAALGMGEPRRARRTAEQARSLARARRDARVELAALMALARAEQALGRDDVAYRRLLAAERCVDRLRHGITAEESRLAFALDKSEVYEALILDRLRVGTPQAIRRALVFAERAKARSLAERLNAGAADELGFGGTAATRLLRQLDRIERELAVAESRIEGAEDGRGVRATPATRVAALVRERSASLDALRRRDSMRSTLVGAVPPPPWPTIEKMAPDERVLEYTAAGGRFHLFSVSRDRIEAFPSLARVERVGELIDGLRFQLGKAVLGEAHVSRFRHFIAPVIRGYLEQLHDLLLAPVADGLDGCRVRIVPHGLLHGLPFHALESDGTALLDRATVSYVPSLTVMGLLGGAPPPSAAPPLVLGAADRHAPLIDAEVDAVREIFPAARVFRGARATLDAVQLSESRPPLMHVACHGVYSESDAWTGALRLGDAWLSMNEIYRLQGTASLVVLSGCETGRGTVHSGDEWIGLVRGFLEVGAQAVVASLWEVDDRSAVQLMHGFYRQLTKGSTVAEALRSAQLDARAAGATALAWAPFMVIGDSELRISRRMAA